MHLIELTINNKSVFVDPRSTILQACETAGIGLSRFCYHENLSVAGNCRRCLVEVHKSPKPVVACARPVMKGRVIFTDTPLARKARESVLEFLLVNHPLDCPICDQGGECDLQDETITYGSDRGRYFEFKRSVENKECGPIVKTIRTRCIHCTRCVRFSAEVAGNEVRGRFGRGEESEIGTYVNSFMNSELSGNLIDLCPVGALTSKPYAYKVRPWELEQVDTVDFFDAVATNITVHKAASEEIVRILPRNDSIYAENWISDRTRYAFDGLKYRPSAVTRTPSYYPYCANFVRGSQSNLERIYSAATYLKTKGVGTVSQTFISPNLCLDIPFFYSFNRAFSSFSENEVASVLQIGTNLRYEASLLNTLLRREQSRRALSYITIAVTTSLRYSHTHQGNSLRSLFSIIENRSKRVKDIFFQTKPLALFAGVNSLRNNQSIVMQQIFRQLGKQFYVKGKTKDRLGFIHSSVGSLAFAHLGFSSKKSTATPVTFTVAQPDYYAVSCIQNNSSPDSKIVALQTKTLYEASGSLRAIQGQRRKHVKVVNSVIINRATKLNFEAEIISFWWSEKSDLIDAKYNSFWDGLSFFDDETPKTTYFETLPISFSFNPFKVTFDFTYIVPLALFTQPIRNFYLEDQVASTSVTMADCALYINQQTNFVNEV